MSSKPSAALLRLALTIAALQLLQENRDPTPAEVRHAIAGNLCRCTGYQLIVKSVIEAARVMREPATAAR